VVPPDRAIQTLRETAAVTTTTCIETGLDGLGLYTGAMADGRPSSTMLTPASQTPLPAGWLDARELSTSRKSIALLFLLVAYFFYAWSWNTIDVLRPYIKESLKLSLMQSGSAYTLQSIGAIVGAVVMGQVADKIGRRNALVISMFGYGSGLLGALWVTDYGGLVVQRIYLGFFMGSMFPIAVGIYSGLFARDIRGRIAGVVLGTYNLAVAALGFVSSAVFKAGMEWTVMLYAGAVPVVLAGLAVFLIPDDRKLVPYDGLTSGQSTATTALPITELFAPSVRRQTLMLALMSGLNFFAYQAFTGWNTTFLRSVKGIPDTAIGDILGWQFIGSAVGSLAWGWVSDRFGRRVASMGFVACAVLIPIYLFADVSVSTLRTIGLVYGAALSCSAIWGPWMSELYPSHLRSTAASIFNWGRLISMMAPLVTAPLAEVFGLAPVMCMASVSFLMATVVWLSLPETVKHRPLS
jgi:MFS family permease